jgi:hypothetical protein
MLAPSMGEIKKRRSETRKVTTMGEGRERNYRNGAKIGEKRKNNGSAYMQNQFL